MKKVLLFILLIPAVLGAQAIMDVKGSYSRIGYETIGTGHGYSVGTGVYYSVYDDNDSFMRDFSVGASADYAAALAKGVWYTYIMAGPEFRLEMPYSFFKIGFGYNYWKVKGLSSIGGMGIKFCAGAIFEVSDEMKLGLDITVAYKLTRGKVSIFSIGPVIAMNI